MPKAKDEESGAGRVFSAECVLHGQPHTVCRDEWGSEINWQPPIPAVPSSKEPETDA